MIACAELLREHAAEIDSDFLSHYGMDVRDLGTARLPWGRFVALLHRLPYTSHLMSALRGEDVAWTAEMHLAASQLEAQQLTNYLVGFLLQANGAGRNPVRKPEPVPRPGVSKPNAGTGLASLIEKLGGTGRIR